MVEWKTRKFELTRKERKSFAYLAFLSATTIGKRWNTICKPTEMGTIQQESRVQNPESRVQCPESRVQDPGSRVQGPEFISKIKEQLHH
jgi:hypothetical protein